MDAPAETKTCTACKTAKAPACFAKKRKGLSPKCKTCQNVYSKAWYQKNRAKRIVQVSARKTAIKSIVTGLAFCPVHEGERRALMSLARIGFSIEGIKTAASNLGNALKCEACIAIKQTN